MLPTVLIGLLIVGAGAGYIVFALFGHRAEPASSGLAVRGVTMSPAKVPFPRRGTDPAPAAFSGDGIRIGFLRRLRSGLLLLLITLGLAGLLATIVGAAVLAIGTLIQH